MYYIVYTFGGFTEYCLQYTDVRQYYKALYRIAVLYPRAAEIVRCGHVV